MKVNRLPRELVIEELWRRGSLEWKLHSTQNKIKDILAKSNKKLFVALCSRRLGKTFLMATIAIEHAIKHPGSRVKFASAFKTDLTEYIVPIFQQIIYDAPDDIRPEYKSQQSKFVFKNGSEIKLVGLDKSPNSLRGNAIELIIIDEAAFVTNLKYIFDSVIYPATATLSDAKIVLISTPPNSPDHDFVEFVQRASLDNALAKFTIYDNPLITPEVVEELKKEAGGEDSTTFKREYLCEIVRETSLAIAPEFELSKHVKPFEIPPSFEFYAKYEALDIGVRDFTAGLFAYYNWDDSKLYIQSEITIDGPRMTTPNLVQLIKEEEVKLGYDKVFRRVADNNNLILIQDLSYIHNIPFIPTTKDNLQAMVNELRIWLQNDRIVISPNCKYLIGCLENGLWNKNRTEFERSRLYKHLDHLAALIYLVRNIDQNTNPYPKNFGYRYDVVITDDSKTANNKAFKTIFGIRK